MAQQAGAAGEASAPPLVRVQLTVKTAIGFVLMLGSVWLLLQLWQILLVVVVALMLVGALNPLVHRLTARGLGHKAAVVVVFVALCA